MIAAGMVSGFLAGSASMYVGILGTYITADLSRIPMSDEAKRNIGAISGAGCLIAAIGSSPFAIGIKIATVAASVLYAGRAAQADANPPIAQQHQWKSRFECGWLTGAIAATVMGLAVGPGAALCVGVATAYATANYCLQP